MGKRILGSRAFGAVVVAGALLIAPVATASAAAAAAPGGVSSAAVRVVGYKNCTALNKVYKGGVAKAGVKYNKVNGKNRAFKVKPMINTALYNANRKLDRDKDGIACEKG
ncbi:excalibur calcium-binding domain-containing protein [Microbacterium sp. NPDC057659]|uniref:excalibur calcium-binding domain-containing protein n=1 Tax=Microbacterium sp. NPDC057659 TaxID=3346198 RepID=UPI00367140FC